MAAGDGSDSHLIAMSPKRKAAAQIHPSSKGESDSDNFDIDMPTWHDEPSEFALWHNRLPEYLIDYDESFQSLVQYGFCWSKHVMCFSSTNHMQRYRQNMLVAGTFSAPTIIIRTAAVVLNATPVDLATATAAAKEAELLELKRFSNNPEQVDKKDKEMARVIAKKMSNPSSRKDWLKKANNSGRTLLQLLQAERARLDSDLQTGIGENVVNDIDDLFKAGVGEATVASFGEFDNNLTELLDILPSTLRPAYPEAVLARKYIAVISSLGERIENKLDGELDRTAAGSNLSKIKTAIRSVLSRHTAREQSLASTNGSAFRASQDPRKAPKAPRGGGGGGGGGAGGGSTATALKTRRGRGNGATGRRPTAPAATVCFWANHHKGPTTGASPAHRAKRPSLHAKPPRLPKTRQAATAKATWHRIPTPTITTARTTSLTRTALIARKRRRRLPAKTPTATAPHSPTASSRPVPPHCSTRASSRTPKPCSPLSNTE